MDQSCTNHRVPACDLTNRLPSLAQHTSTAHSTQLPPSICHPDITTKLNLTNLPPPPPPPPTSHHHHNHKTTNNKKTKNSRKQDPTHLSPDTTSNMPKCNLPPPSLHSPSPSTPPPSIQLTKAKPLPSLLRLLRRLPNPRLHLGPKSAQQRPQPPAQRRGLLPADRARKGAIRHRQYNLQLRGGRAAHAIRPLDHARSRGRRECRCRRVPAVTALGGRSGGGGRSADALIAAATAVRVPGQARYDGSAAASAVWVPPAVGRGREGGRCWVSGFSGDGGGRRGGSAAVVAWDGGPAGVCAASGWDDGSAAWCWVSYASAPRGVSGWGTTGRWAAWVRAAWGEVV